MRKIEDEEIPRDRITNFVIKNLKKELTLGPRSAACERASGLLSASCIISGLSSL